MKVSKTCYFNCQNAVESDSMSGEWSRKYISGGFYDLSEIFAKRILGFVPISEMKGFS